MSEQPATFTFKRTLSGKTLKAWRNAQGYTAQALASELGVSRQYVKSIEGGSLEASQKFIRKFDSLRAQLGDGTAQSREPKAIILRSVYQLPTSLEILAKPRRCPGCCKWFVPVTPNQRMHTNERCKRAARKRRKGVKR